MGVSQLDDEDYPALTVGQAAQLLQVQQAFLRRLDTTGVVRSQRSGGGHRRSSRRQLERAARVRELLDEGHNLAAAAQILALEDERDHAVGERDQVLDERNLARQQRDEAYRLLDELQDRGSAPPRPGGPAAGRADSDGRTGAGAARGR